MPYFAWKGIDLEGVVHKGTLYARSANELDAILFKQEIALLWSEKVKPGLFVYRSLGLPAKIDFFRQLAELLGSGVFLPDALTVIASQTTNAAMQEVVDGIANYVEQGHSLSYALGAYPNVFDIVMVHMVHAGQESGRLVQALTMLSDYLQHCQDFKRKARAAAAVPMVTFAFFCVVLGAIFIWVVPQFMHMFQTSGQELPQVTQAVIHISDLLHSHYAVFMVAALGGAVALVGLLLKTKQGLRLWHCVSLYLPVTGSLVKDAYLGYFLQSLAMLLEGGMQIVPAMGIAREVVGNGLLKDGIISIQAHVEAGRSVSQALTYDGTGLFDAQTIAIVRVGEESGRLSVLLGRAAQRYQDMVNRSIATITNLINPLLMVVLGILITFLIFAVYLPVFSLSNII